jgi:acyl carrier protein
LADDTPLITTGILDSLGTLKLVAFLEEQYDIKIEPHETDEEYLGSVARILSLVQSKR